MFKYKVIIQESNRLGSDIYIAYFKRRCSAIRYAKKKLKKNPYIEISKISELKGEYNGNY